MAESKTLLRTFNRGLVSQLALARTDLERVPLSADTMNNWMPRNLGSMMLRPGTQYIGNTDSNNEARVIPFIYATDDTALIELTDTTLRVWVDEVVITRPVVSSAVSNGDFATGTLDDWTDNDEGGGAVSTKVSTGAFTYMRLEGDGVNAAVRTQEVTVGPGDQNVEHVLVVKISLVEPQTTGYQAGVPAMIRVGSTDGDDDYVTETSLGSGEHHLAFTPTGSFWIQFSNRENAGAYVEDCNLHAGGDMEITAPWAEADLGLIRYDQSGDIVYVAAAKTTDNIGYQQRTIERRSTRSWSLVKYEPLDGPFGAINLTPITIAPSGLDGTRTLTASGPLFKSEHRGGLIRISSVGQSVTDPAIIAQDTWTNDIRVFGVTTERIFTITIAGTFVATVTLQRSFSDPDVSADWKDVQTWSAPVTTTYDDTLDNQVAWYRIGVDTGDFTSGSVDVSLDYSNGSIDGIAFITSVSSSTSAGCTTVQDFGSTTATTDWYLSEWSGVSGFPSTVAFAEGRLGWAGKNKVWLSVSDAYDSFDDNTIGDSGPITRTIGSGPVDDINWMLGLKRLCFGTDSVEWNLRSSNEDEPLTPSSSIPRRISTQGSGEVHGLMLDRSGLYVQRGGTRLMEVAFNPGDYEFESVDLSVLYPESGGDSQIVRIALQRQPDTRIHCVRADGTVAVLLHDKTENVSCWITLSTKVEGTPTDIDVSAATLDSDSLVAADVASMQFNDDGTKIVTLELDGDTLTEWEGDAWDLPSMTKNGISLNYDDLNSDMQALSFGDSGNKLYLAARVNNTGYQYTLQTPYSVGLAEQTKTYSFANEVTQLYAVEWKPDGTKCYALDGSGDEIYQYTAGTAWDIETLTYDSKSFDVSGVGVPREIRFDTEGKHVFVSDSGGGINQFDFGTAWEVDTLTDPSLELATGIAGVSGFAYHIAANGNTRTHRFYVPSRTLNTISQFSETEWSVGDSVIEDVAVLPGGDGDGEDAVYYAVKRVINGSDVRFLEKWSLESECEGGTLNKNLDSHIVGTVSGGVMTGLSHLEGQMVAVWVNGKDVGTYEVSGGQITGVTEDGSAVAGLSYRARFKSTKLGNLTQKKQGSRLALIMRNVHYQGIESGVDFDNLDPLPLVKDESIIEDDTVHVNFDEESFSLDGVWEADARLCLQAESPRPVTVLAAIIDLEE